ncbi:ETEC_3214 domain-containing protein [Bdellovibrio bacteriovorus]|uniref:ETEC_3214 domain-containing protein n=1 Tax=Bdellovibrio bacteriovorus TaxID=959 RepID=UPI003AA8C6C2
MNKTVKLLKSIPLNFTKVWKWIIDNPRTSFVISVFAFLGTEIAIPLALDEMKDRYKSIPTSAPKEPTIFDQKKSAAKKNVNKTAPHQVNERPEEKILGSLRLNQNIDSNPILKSYPYEEMKHLTSEQSQVETVRTYCTQDMYLQITYENETKKISDYLVISKNRSLNPRIPGLEKPLGKFRFNGYSKTIGKTHFIAFRSHYQGYFEELIRPEKSTNWVQVGVGYYRIGANYNNKDFEWGPAFGEESTDEGKLAGRIRIHYFPNAYLVSNGPRFFSSNEGNSPQLGSFPEWYTGASYSTFNCSDIPQQE